jgi:hypothetical protein
MTNKFHGTVKTDVTSVTIPVLLRSTTDSSGMTGITSASVTARYWRQGGTATTITVSALTNITDAHSSGGWKEVDATNCPGLYRFDVPDASVVAGADWVVVTIKVSGSYGVYERLPLESHGAEEVYSQVTDSTFGLSNLVRATTPANKLTVDVSGNAAADLKLWKTVAPLDLTSQLVQSQAQLSSQGITDVRTGVGAELDETLNEPSTGAPTASPTLRNAIAALYLSFRNKVTNDGSWLTFYNDTGTAVFKARVSEESGLVTRNELQAP